MINGEVLMQDKKILLDVDENELIAKAEERIKKLLNI
jgi:hypothetical protein